MNNLNEVFSAILKVYDKTKSIDAAIEAANLTDEQKKRVQEAFAALESFNQSAKSLAKAKEQGASRVNWITESITTAAEAKDIEDVKVEEVIELLDTESVKVKDERFKEGE